MPLENKDYYKILQVDPSADREVIEVAYKRLARKYHPDTNKSPDATLRMQEMNAAYGVLRNPVKRVQYDRERSSQTSRPDAKYEEERRKREEAEAAQHRAQEETQAARHRAEQAQRKLEEVEAALHHVKEEAETARRHAEAERRKKEETEAAQRRAQEEQQQREKAEAAQPHTEYTQRQTVAYIVCLKCYEENASSRRRCVKCGHDLHSQEERQKSKITKGYTLSVNEAAQAIGVNRWTMQGYIKSGRINVNPDGTIDADELLQEFIIRDLPTRRGW